MAASRKHYKLSEVLGLLEDSSDNDSSENECSDGDFLDEDLHSPSDDELSVDDIDDIGDAAEESQETESTPPRWEKWTPSEPAFQQMPFTVPNSGIQNADSLPDNELGYFQMFFSDDILDSIVKETNRYAQEKLQGLSLPPFSIWRTWHDVELIEMKAYFGMILNMAINDRPDIKDYFSQQWIDRMPFFADVMPRLRFAQIHWMLHVSPPITDSVNSVLTRGAKVSNVLKHLQCKCLQNFVPGQHIAIDESTVGFKGRVAWKMYNPQKPTKWGLRVYVLADSETGYICAFEPYYGRQTTEVLPRPDLLFTSRIVIHLCDVLLNEVTGSGYHLFTDRYYTSPELARELLQKKIHLTGTVQKNRKGLPNEVKRKLKLKQQEVVAFTIDKKLMSLVWQDKRQVLMLSTFYNADTHTIQRTNKKQTVDVAKPVMISEYTKYMGAVDRADHYCASYGFSRKSLKWWRKLFYWLLEVAVVNSFILFNIQRRNNGLAAVSHIEYRKAVLLQLIGDVRNADGNRKRGRPSSHDNEERLNRKPHLVSAFPEKKTKDCTVCSDRKVPGQRKKTIYYCKTCSRKPGLHPKDCFEKYHTMRNYRE